MIRDNTTHIASIKVKTKAHYTCQECGSTEFIQAHHQIPKDDDSLGEYPFITGTRSNLGGGINAS